MNIVHNVSTSVSSGCLICPYWHETLCGHRSLGKGLDASETGCIWNNITTDL